MTGGQGVLLTCLVMIIELWRMVVLRAAFPDVSGCRVERLKEGEGGTAGVVDGS